MVKASHGPRRKTRRRLKKRERLSIKKMLQTFEIGEKVVIKPHAAVQKGMPHRRFFGKVGKVVDRRGKAYVLEVKDGKAIKQVISLPVHLRRL